ncbi:protein-lysine methyltransferase METTL21E-like [Mantella aurantiaca]
MTELREKRLNKKVCNPGYNLDEKRIERKPPFEPIKDLQLGDLLQISILLAVTSVIFSFRLNEDIVLSTTKLPRAISLFCLDEVRTIARLYEFTDKVSSQFDSKGVVVQEEEIDYHFNSEQHIEKYDHNKDECIVPKILERRFLPAYLTNVAWEGFNYVGHEIKIRESTDLFGATVWPSALVLCYFLEKQGKQLGLEDKRIIEIGSGTGLVSIVASLLGAQVIATDLEDLIGNLQYNVVRNTKLKCKYAPQVKELTWGSNLEEKFPRCSSHFGYILATDVVYNHPYLDELLETFDHLSQEETIILWAMKFRKENTLLQNTFFHEFQKMFDMEVIYDLPSLSIKLYSARRIFTLIK